MPGSTFEENETPPPKKCRISNNLDHHQDHETHFGTGVNGVKTTSASNRNSSLVASASEVELGGRFELNVDNIQIPVQPPGTHKRQNKYQFELLNLRHKLSQLVRVYHLNLHKTNILWWISHMNYVNQILNKPKLADDVLKMAPPLQYCRTVQTDIEYFQQLTEFYKKVFPIKQNTRNRHVKKCSTLDLSLHDQIKNKVARGKLDFLFIFVIFARANGLQCRIVRNFVVAPLRPALAGLVPINQPVSRNNKNKRFYVKRRKTIRKIKKKSPQGEINIEQDQIDFNRKWKIDQLDGTDDRNMFTSGSDKIEGNGQNSIPHLTLNSQPIEISSDEDLKTTNTNQKSLLDSPKRIINKKINLDYWIELYSVENKRWYCVDLLEAKINCAVSVSAKATQPITYVFAWHNDNTIKEVTPRYTLENSTLRSRRVSQCWLDETLKNFTHSETDRDKLEDAEFLISKSFPKTVGEFKNHPLYALNRYLLSFEVIYPSDAPILGFIRNEAIYPRDCVCTLHPIEYWLKQARILKADETSYKTIPNTSVGLFGRWQTKEYEPPAAEYGIVPRNANGNVELYKECMLPKNTIHLKMNGVSRICRRMGIDCAPAVVDLNLHNGRYDPVYEGYVVCEQFGDLVVQAWRKNQTVQKEA